MGSRLAETTTSTCPGPACPVPAARQALSPWTLQTKSWSQQPNILQGRNLPSTRWPRVLSLETNKFSLRIRVKTKKKNRKDFAATFQHLFGPPTPAAVRRMRNKKFYEGETPHIRKSNKPLPVNPLTGHTIGEFKSLSVSTPHLHLIREPRMKHKHSQLW